MKKNSLAAFAIIALVSIVAAGPATGDDPPGSRSKGRVLWQTDSPSCLDKNLPPLERARSVERFVVGGEMVGPEQATAPKPTKSEYESTGEQPKVIALELVLNKSGKVESIVALTEPYPATEALLTRYVSKWEFKPATQNGEAICVQYILVNRAHPW